MDEELARVRVKVESSAERGLLRNRTELGRDSGRGVRDGFERNVTRGRASG